MSKYITFHNHSTKSLLDSCLKVSDLVKWAKANNMSSVGITDHGEMGALLDLYKECKKQDIKPILGIEFYITENKVDEEGKKIRDNWHLIALAKNINGWHNIIKLHNLSFKDERYYYDPRITFDDLEEFKDGLIITSACIGGVIGRPWLNEDIELSVQNFKKLYKMFGEDFYLELQNHNDENLENREKQHKYNKFLIKLSKEYGVKCVVQNDSHYYLKEHWEAHQVLLCKNTGSKLNNPKFTFGSKEYYLKNETEVLEIFDEYPLTFIEECFKNTSEISNKIEHFDITNKVYDCPTFGDKEQSFNKLRNMTYSGLKKKFTQDFLDSHPEYINRIEYELDVVKKVNFVDYFLLLEDLYSFTSKNNIYMGIGRGSAGGSLVLYCLDVISVNPIQYNLLFERFINVDRVSMCDVDCDCNDKDRPKVIEYLKKRYGEEHVCNICTYGELTAKASFKAVASVMGIPFDKANSLSAVMDSTMSLKENYEQIDIFRCACQNDAIINRAYNIALVLEGTYAQKGLHACGLVISSKPLNDVCPCVTVKDPKGKERIVSTTFEMKEIDGDLKLLKLDILGLRNLGIIEEADKIIKKRNGVVPDFKNLDVNDEKTYKMLSDGYTSTVFQFESLLMQRIIKQVQPTCIEDLSCITALARPGCLDSGLTDSFIKRRKGEEKVQSLVSGTEEYMKDTLQLPIYQENCMQIARVMAGFSGSEADTLRKYIGKKDPVKLKAEREHFVSGAVNLGHSKEKANEIFDAIEKFGSYGFNKSHAVGYSLLSYATAYYKANYPQEFMTAVLNSVLDDIDKLNLYISECYRLGITVLPPDVNKSDKNFVLTDDGEILFGLNAIKGLGKSAVTDIINTRKYSKFTSIENFIERTTKVDKSNIQSLLRVGAFNTIEKNPKFWDKLCDYTNEAKNSKFYKETLDLKKSVYNLIGTRSAKKSEKYVQISDIKRSLGGSKNDTRLKEDYNKQQSLIIDKFIKNTERYFAQFSTYKSVEKIQYEQELLGFNVSTNPYKRWNDFKKFFTSNKNNNIPYVEFNELFEKSDLYYSNDIKFHTVALLSDIKEFKTKKGKRMAKITIEYYGVKSSLTIFADKWESDLEFKVQKGNLLSIVGKLQETNKNYCDDDYEIRFESIRQLNVLINESNRCIINIEDKEREELDNIIKNVSNTERLENLPIEKMIIYEKGGKYMILSGLCWINNVERLEKRI